MSKSTVRFVIFDETPEVKCYSIPYVQGSVTANYYKKKRCCAKTSKNVISKPLLYNVNDIPVL